MMISTKKGWRSFKFFFCVLNRFQLDRRKILPQVWCAFTETVHFQPSISNQYHVHDNEKIKSANEKNQQKINLSFYTLAKNCNANVSKNWSGSVTSCFQSLFRTSKRNFSSRTSSLFPHSSPNLSNSVNSAVP